MAQASWGVQHSRRPWACELQQSRSPHAQGMQDNLAPRTNGHTGDCFTHQLLLPSAARQICSQRQPAGAAESSLPPHRAVLQPGRCPNCDQRKGRAAVLQGCKIHGGTAACPGGSGAVGLQRGGCSCCWARAVASNPTNGSRPHIGQRALTSSLQVVQMPSPARGRCCSPPRRLWLQQ